MQVAPEILRAFAGQTSTTSSTITENTLAGKAVEAFQGMPGSSSLWAAAMVDVFTEDLTTKLSAGFDALATAARGTADSFEVADADLTAEINATFPR